MRQMQQQHKCLPACLHLGVLFLPLSARSIGRQQVLKAMAASSEEDRGAASRALFRRRLQVGAWRGPRLGGGRSTLQLLALFPPFPEFDVGAATSRAAAPPPVWTRCAAGGMPAAAVNNLARSSAQ